MNGNFLGTLLAILIFIATSSPETAPQFGQKGGSMGVMEVHGYYVEDSRPEYSSYGSFAKNSDKLASVSLFLYSVDGQGNIKKDRNSKAETVARSRGVKTLALVHNIRNGSFDKQVIHSVLSSKEKRAKAAEQLLGIIESNGYDGVNIDFENIPAGDRNMMNTFISELAEKLHARGYTLAVSVPAKMNNDTKSSWTGAFDYGFIGRTADLVMVMAYDQHHPGGDPGPIAAPEWLERVIRYAKSEIPVSKLVIGIPLYGYDWNTQTKEAVGITSERAASLASKNGITPLWHNRYQTPYFTYYSNGIKREVWFENIASLESKVTLIKRYGISKVALWRLGYESTAVWSLL